MNTAGEIHFVDCRWMSKIDSPPWVVCVVRHCTFGTGVVTSVTTAVVGIMSWISAVAVNVHTALIGRSVECCVVSYHRRVYYKQRTSSLHLEEFHKEDKAWELKLW